MKDLYKNDKLEKKWHALYVKSRAEKKVMEILMDKGFEAYVPITKIMKQWSDRKKMIESPLISGYVFVKISNSEYEKTLQTKGVVNFVHCEGKKAVVKEEEVEQLKQLVKLGYNLEVSSIKNKHKEGDKIKISSGVLKNIEGYVIENKEGRFVEVLLKSLGQSIKVKLPQELLIPVN